MKTQMKTKIIYFMTFFIMSSAQVYASVEHHYDFRFATHDTDSKIACTEAQKDAKIAPVCDREGDVGSSPFNSKWSECDCRDVIDHDQVIAKRCVVVIEWDCETKKTKE